MRCEIISWNTVQRLARSIAQKIRADAYVPDIIIAIGRGGYVPARILADYLDSMNLTSMKIEHYRSGADKQEIAKIKYPLGVDVNGMRLLVVDDVSDSGDTFQLAIDHIQSLYTPQEIRTAVLHHKTVSSYQPDYFAHRIIRWRWLIYPWAVIEDIHGFIAHMDSVPDTVAGIRQKLLDAHGIRVPTQVIEDALLLFNKETTG